MQIIQTALFKIVQAETGMVLYNKIEKQSGSENISMFKKLYVPLKVSDETILATYQEVDIDDFNFVIAPQTTYTKLQIRRACRTLGLEEKLDTVINSNATFQKDWQDAITIDLKDQVLTQALLNGNFTEQEIESIKEVIAGVGLSTNIDQPTQE